MDEERDVLLGEQLSKLPTPDHREGFWSALDARLRAERTMKPATASTPKPRRGAVVALVAIAAVVAIVVGVVMPSIRNAADPDRSVVAGPDPTSPADPSDDRPVVSGEVPASVRGTATVVDTSGDRELTLAYRFARNRDGSYEVVNETTGDRIAYDAADRRSISTFSADDETIATIDVNLPPGAPDRYPFTSLPGGLGLEQFVVTAGLSQLASIEDGTSRNGRRTWTYEGPVAPNELAGGGPDEIEATVDQQTGVLVGLVEKAGGEVLRRLTVDTFVVSAAAAIEVDTSAPAGARVETTDRRFEEVSIEDLGAGRTGAAAPPLYPTRDRDDCDPTCPPKGWELAGIWVLDGAGGPTGPEGSNPPSTDVAALLYTDGWRQITVTTRALVDDADAWSDPFRGEGQLFEGEASFELEGDGAFAGAKGSQVIDPTTVPHVWAVSCGEGCEDGGSEGYVLTVAGDGSIDDLRQFANVARSA